MARFISMKAEVPKKNLDPATSARLVGEKIQVRTKTSKPAAIEPRDFMLPYPFAIGCSFQRRVVGVADH
jgi:hypothetical protein